MLISEVVHYYIKSPMSGSGLLLKSWSGRSQVAAKTTQITAITIAYSSKTNGKALSLKIPQYSNAEYREAMLELSEKLLPCHLA